MEEKRNIILDGSNEDASKRLEELIEQMENENKD